MTTLSEAIKCLPKIRPTRQTTGYRLDMGGCNVSPNFDPFYDFDHCELLEGRSQALEQVEKSDGPSNKSEALWPEDRIRSLLSFANDRSHERLKCEKDFALRLLAWYVSSSETENITTRAIEFALETLHQVGFMYPIGNKLITAAISKAMQKYPECYAKVPNLGQFMGKLLWDLLREHHDAESWEMASDILAAACTANDSPMDRIVENLLERYLRGETGRCPQNLQQELWTASEIGYLQKAHDVFLAVHNTEGI